MSAAAKCVPVAIGGISHGFSSAQPPCPRLFKEEVLDPGYASNLIHPPNGLTVNSHSLSVAPSPTTPTSIPIATTSNATAPNATGPNATAPNATGPNATALNATASNATAPNATAPNATAPNATAPNATAPNAKPKRPYKRKTNGTTNAKKVKTEPVAHPDANGTPSGTAQSQIGDHMPVQKRKRDRFKGTTEEEVLTRVLPDHIREDLDILIVGINPGLTAAYVQHHYAGPGNHFWKCLYLSGMIPEPMNALQDAELQNYGIGFTNIVARTTRGSADLTRKEIYEGGQILKEKMLKYLPKIALFNGKGIYEVFCGHKNFNFGLQPEPFPGCPETCVFVNPSSSARCTQLPRAVDKVPFYEALKRVRDHMRVHGRIDGIDRSTVTFPDFKLVTAPQKAKKEVKEEPKEANVGDGMETPATTAPPSTAAAQPSATTATTKSGKPKKPRGRPKREKAAAAGMAVSAAPSLTNGGNVNAAPQSYMNHHMPHQRNDIAVSANHTQQQTHGQQTHGQQPHGPQFGTDFTIKREIVDAHHDKELAAIIQHTINAQQSMLQQQQQSMTAMAASSIPHSIAAANPALVMPSTAPSAVKQERPDWNGYGVMPAYNNAVTPTTMASYPQYSCYWSYLPTTSSFMSNGFSGIAAPQIAQQQAVAAAAALHTSVAVSQANVSVATPAVVSYNSPQEASSPAMSSQSNLTQASLDSLPKADSASTVANWLQSIPHS